MSYLVGFLVGAATFSVLYDLRPWIKSQSKSNWKRFSEIEDRLLFGCDQW